MIAVKITYEPDHKVSQLGIDEQQHIERQSIWRRVTWKAFEVRPSRHHFLLV